MTMEQMIARLNFWEVEIARIVDMVTSLEAED